MSRNSLLKAGAKSEGFDSLLSKYQCGFPRGYNAQHCLVSLIEKWKKSVDKGCAFGALLTDLSKAFDCLPLELLIAQLDTYGFDKSSLKLIHSYLSNRKQRVKVNDRYSSWSEILFGVPKGSISEPHNNIPRRNILPDEHISPNKGSSRVIDKYLE